jgi:hypothetical protein
MRSKRRTHARRGDSKATTTLSAPRRCFTQSRLSGTGPVSVSCRAASPCSPRWAALASAWARSAARFASRAAARTWRSLPTAGSGAQASSGRAARRSRSLAVGQVPDVPASLGVRAARAWCQAAQFRAPSGGLGSDRVVGVVVAGLAAARQRYPQAVVRRRDRRYRRESRCARRELAADAPRSLHATGVDPCRLLSPGREDQRRPAAIDLLDRVAVHPWNSDCGGNCGPAWFLMPAPWSRRSRSKRSCLRAGR